MTKQSNHPTRYVEAIKGSGLTIYEPIEVGNVEHWIPTPELEELLDSFLSGYSLSGLPLRTRSKVVKEEICRVLGYPVPSIFKKTQPRFLGQQFDCYVQKSNNLQIWNEELDATRRYVLIRVGDDDKIKKVKVVTGDTLALLDTTGTLTQKYQARLVLMGEDRELIAKRDTELMQHLVEESVELECSEAPTNHPRNGEILSIAKIFERLQPLIGMTFRDSGFDQERNRGAALHRLICKHLGYTDYQDDGRFPDVRHQLLEVKLQTSPTIDLGLVCPDSTSPLDVPMIDGHQIRHCDVRYVLFYATMHGNDVKLTHMFLTTGEKFFTRFARFGGNVLNRKIQIPLPSGFFD